MDYEIRRKELSEKVEALYRLAKEIYMSSKDFPTTNCNAVRVLGGTRVMKINLENPED